MKSTHLSARNTIITQSVWTGDRSVYDATAFITGTLQQLRRSIIFIVIWVSTFIMSSFVYSRLLTPDFIATTQILIQPQVILNDGPEKLRQFYQLVLDGYLCETELRVLSSQQILYKVFESQNLTAAAEIQGGADGIWAFVGIKLDRLRNLSTKESASIELFNAFLRRVRVRRLGLSYVIEVSYRAHSAEQATRVVNAIASTYAAYRLRGVLAREQRRGFYLESRLSSLQQQITASEAGSRLGVIPEHTLLDSDIRLLGPANRPLGIAYPKTSPLILMMGGFGLISGLLIVLLSRRVPARHTSPMVISPVIYKA